MQLITLLSLVTELFWISLSNLFAGGVLHKIRGSSHGPTIMMIGHCDREEEEAGETNNDGC